MTPRMILMAFALLSQTGCVAALPQLMSGSNSDQFCSMAKLPGQANSFCKQLGIGQQPDADMSEQAPRNSPNAAIANSAVR
jgi:hypothetical protein